MKGRETDIFDEKMAIAKELKDKGKVLFRENKYDAAISEFEKALSVFNWIETTNPNWRTEVAYIVFLMRLLFNNYISFRVFVTHNYASIVLFLRTTMMNFL